MMRIGRFTAAPPYNLQSRNLPVGGLCGPDKRLFAFDSNKSSRVWFRGDIHLFSCRLQESSRVCRMVGGDINILKYKSLLDILFVDLLNIQVQLLSWLHPNQSVRHEDGVCAGKLPAGTLHGMREWS